MYVPKEGDRVRVIALHRRDAYEYVSEEFIGKEGVVTRRDPHWCSADADNGFFSVTVRFDDQNHFLREGVRTFHGVKLEKLP